jgi:hypothetical protein
VPFGSASRLMSHDSITDRSGLAVVSPFEKFNCVGSRLNHAAAGFSSSGATIKLEPGWGCKSRALEEQLQSQLDRAAASRTEHGVRSGEVRRRAAAAKSGAENRGIVHAKSVLPAVGIGKIGMV